MKVFNYIYMWKCTVYLYMWKIVTICTKVCKCKWKCVAFVWKCPSDSSLLVEVWKNFCMKSENEECERVKMCVSAWVPECEKVSIRVLKVWTIKREGDRQSQCLKSVNVCAWVSSHVYCYVCRDARKLKR